MRTAATGLCGRTRKPDAVGIGSQSGCLEALRGFGRLGAVSQAAVRAIEMERGASQRRYRRYDGRRDRRREARTTANIGARPG